MRSCVDWTAAARIFGTRPLGIGSHDACLEHAKHLPLPDPPLQPAVMIWANVHGTVSGMGNVFGSSPRLMTNSVWKAAFTSWSEVIAPGGMATSFIFVPAGKLAAHAGVGCMRVTVLAGEPAGGCLTGGGGGGPGGGAGGWPSARATDCATDCAVKGLELSRVFVAVCAAVCSAVGAGAGAAAAAPPPGGVIEPRKVLVIADGDARAGGAGDPDAVAAGDGAVDAAVIWRAAAACAWARACFACASCSSPAFPEAVIAVIAACAWARSGATDDATWLWIRPGAHACRRLPMVDTIVMCWIWLVTDPTMPTRSSAAVSPRMRFVITACVNSAINMDTANSRCSKGSICT